MYEQHTLCNKHIISIAKRLKNNQLIFCDGQSIDDNRVVR